MQFYIDGQRVGRPERLDRGHAFLPLFGANGSVTAVYSGDNYYNTSTNQPVSVS